MDQRRERMMEELAREREGPGSIARDVLRGMV